MEKDIKDYRGKELKSYVIANFLAILYGTNFLYKIAELIGGNRDISVIASSATFAVFTAVIYIFVFLADALVPSEIKDKAIWPCGCKPGEKIFTEIREQNEDNRFSAQHVERLYADVYASIDAETNENMKKDIQNNNWYYIYKLHENEAQVCVSQRDSLLCRDLTIITITLFIGFLVLSFISSTSFSWGTLIFLIVEYVVTGYLARYKGIRFAYNVIATDIVAKLAEEKSKNRATIAGEGEEYSVIVQRK